MKRILVTGGAGFIGMNLVKRLMSEGHEVWSIDNYDTGTKENHIEGAIYHEQDIQKENFWNKHSQSWLKEIDFDEADIVEDTIPSWNPKDKLIVNFKIQWG